MFADGVEFDPNLAPVVDGDCNCTVKFRSIDGIQKDARMWRALLEWKGGTDRDGWEAIIASLPIVSRRARLTPWPP